MFKEYDVVSLNENLDNFGLKAGAIGTVLIVYVDEPPAYEVEFCDAEGQTLALLTLKENDLRLA